MQGIHFRTVMTIETEISCYFEFTIENISKINRYQNKGL